MLPLLHTSSQLDELAKVTNLRQSDTHRDWQLPASIVEAATKRSMTAINKYEALGDMVESVRGIVNDI